MEITIIPLGDNYSYLLSEGNQACVVDACQADPIIALLKQRELSLQAVLSTHSHLDHTGGNLTLKNTYACEIIANDNRTPGVTRMVRERDTIIFADQRIQVITTPGHTLDSICYYIAGTPGILFTGDTLFVAGCGRLLGGTIEQLWQSFKKINALPDDTLVYCGHDYTQDNVSFLASREPNHPQLPALDKKLKTSTIPSTLGDEKKYNCFLQAETIADLAVLRSAKDIF